MRILLTFLALSQHLCLYKIRFISFLKRGGHTMNWNAFLLLFPATFLNIDFVLMLLFSIGGAFLLGLFPLLSDFISKVTGIPGIPESELSMLKRLVCIGSGLFALWYVFVASSAGFLYLAIFLSVILQWFVTCYTLAATCEKRFLRMSEFWHIIYPWMFWRPKSSKE